MTEKRVIAVFFAIGISLLTFLIVAFLLWKQNGKTSPTKTKVWSIGIYAGDSPLNLSPPESVTNPVLTAQDVTDVPADFVADPFMIQVKDTWYMFFEVFNSQTKQGDIGLAVSQDGYHWNYRKIVLDKSYHLSYPYVFHWRGDYYMIPESSQAHSVQLFRADEFPFGWSYVGRLLAGNYVDSTVFHFDHRFWLFAETNPKGNDRLSLFLAEELTGPWFEHPKSPIIPNDGHVARPAGRILLSAGCFLRYAQDDFPEYGNRIRALAIGRLTPDAYEEKEVIMNPVLKGNGKGWNADGMHHIDCHQLIDGTWRACVDGYRYSLIRK